MQMTKEEIARDYRLAKDKNAQVGILAELNGCKKEDIIDALVEVGELQDGRKKKSSSKKNKKETVDSAEMKNSECEESSGESTNEETDAGTEKIVTAKMDPISSGNEDVTKRGNEQGDTVGNCGCCEEKKEEREIGSINIDTGKVSIWISFR